MGKEAMNKVMFLKRRIGNKKNLEIIYLILIVKIEKECLAKYNN
jgi:hypothetical protein